MSDPVEILVLEDDPDMLAGLCEALEDHGYRATPATSGGQALELARKQTFDLVVADIRMEGMDGLEVLERVKSEQPEVGSLVVTGYSTENDPIRALRLGVGDYLKKPFRLAEFLAAVHRILEQRHQAELRHRLERALQATTLSALRQLARALDLGAGTREFGCQWCGALAMRLGAEFGLEPSHAAHLEMAAVLAALRDMGQPTAELEAEAPEEVRGLLASPSPVLELVLLARNLCSEQGEAPSSLALELARKVPGRFEAALLERLENALGEGPPRPVSDRSRWRSLLALAQALFQAGHLESARQALEEVLERGPISREGVSARLGLARLAARAGRPARDLVQEAVSAARSVGPALESGTLLEGGVLLSDCDPQGALPMLKEAVRSLSELGSEPEAALARLAIHRLTRPDPAALAPALQVLLRPEGSRLAMAAADWLVPCLAEWQAAQAEEVYQRALERLAAEAPPSLAHRPMSPAARRELVRAVSSQPQARALLHALAQDPDPGVAGLAGRYLAEVGDASAGQLRVRSLGSFEVSVGSQLVDEQSWKTRKVRYLLAYLLSSGDRPVNEDAILEEFWPGDADKARRNLYAAASTLRKVLCPVGSIDPLIRTQSRLHLNPAVSLWHDLTEFEAGMQASRTLLKAGDRTRALEHLQRSAHLIRGPYMDGCYMDWVFPHRARLDRLYEEAWLQLGRHALEQGRGPEAAELAGRILEMDPYHQTAALLAMQAHVRSGRPEAAVKLFTNLQRSLQRDLKMEPTIELVETYHRARLSLSDP